jgi:hypothetical protein
MGKHRFRAETIATFEQMERTLHAVDDLHGEHYRMLHDEIAELRDELVDQARELTALRGRIGAVEPAVAALSREGTR